MGDFLFVIKCLVVTIAVVVLLQIRVGSRTIEGHTMTWIHHSSISQHLQDVAEGAVKVGVQAKRGVASLVGNESPQEPEPQAEASTGGWFKIKRSTAYRRQKSREAEAARQQREANEHPISSEAPASETDEERN